MELQPVTGSRCHTPGRCVMGVSHPQSPGRTGRQRQTSQAYAPVTVAVTFEAKPQPWPQHHGHTSPQSKQRHDQRAIEHLAGQACNQQGRVKQSARQKSPQHANHQRRTSTPPHGQAFGTDPDFSPSLLHPHGLLGTPQQDQSQRHHGHMKHAPNRPQCSRLDG